MQSFRSMFGLVFHIYMTSDSLLTCIWLPDSSFQMAAGTPHLGWCFRSSVWSGRPYPHIAGGLLHLLDCTVHCATGCRGVI
jgi:hypothetical protein